MATEDAFERAAKREQVEEARLEAMRKGVKHRASSYWEDEDEPVGRAVAVFFLPWVVWGLLRAANHVWGTPSTDKAIIRFFFGSGFWFAALTVWMLVLVWVWMIQRASGASDDS